MKGTFLTCNIHLILLWW